MSNKHKNKNYEKKAQAGKRAWVIFALVMAVIILGCLTTAVIFDKKKDKANDSGGAYIVGYLPYYSSEAADRIDFSALTHLNIAFANPRKDGTLYLEMSDSSIRKIIKKCHKNGVKAMLSLGGGSIDSTNYNALMRDNSAGIQQFNAQITAFCQKYDFDGVDIDFEFIASSPAWEYFEDWMLALKKQCDKHDLLLTAAVATWYSDNITPAAMDCFEYITVMAYDNDGDSQNHSSYEYAVREMQYYENQGIDKHKLILGVPFYGYRYTDSGAMDWSSAASYRYLLSMSMRAKNSDVYDGYAYNGRETIRRKAELSKEYGGIMIWELSQDADGSESLLRLIKNVYGR